MYGASARRQRRIISTVGICFGFPQAYEWLKGEKFTLEMQFGSELISRNRCRWGREPSPNAFSEGVQVVKRAFSKPSPKSGVRSVMATGRIGASKGDLFRRGLPNNPHTRSSSHCNRQAVELASSSRDDDHGSMESSRAKREIGGDARKQLKLDRNCNI